MRLVHILTKGFASPNGAAFLFPLHKHRRRLAAAGCRFRCFTAMEDGLTECDALVIDSRFYSARWAKDGAAALSEIENLARKVTALLYFDISDSTGWLQAQVLPVVTLYCKAQLLKDREAYLRPHYGNRIWADHYHRTAGVTDKEPARATPVAHPGHLEKLRVSWNSGLADYSRWGPTLMGLRRHIPLDALLRYPREFTSPGRDRPIPVACRFGTGYERDTVIHQRREIRKLMGAHTPTDKLSRGAYLEEMRSARVVVSPFGYGEITLKDFEALLCGAVLYKPDISHMETWPDLFQGGRTIVTHNWDLTDFQAGLDAVLQDDGKRRDVAERGQSLYRHHIAEVAGADEFCRRFIGLVDEALAA
jgi:hypothetical protein